MTDYPQNVLIIGGHGRIALLATPLLTQNGHHVTSMIRDAAQAPEITALGAEPLVRDLTHISPQEWADLTRDRDVVVWSAGNGGKSGPETTYAVDRDGALALIEGLESLREAAPHLVMVSYLGATTATAEDDGGTWFAYVEAKKAVDVRLHDSSLSATILGPGRLTDEPADGIHRHEPGTPKPNHVDTSRDLVAQVIAHVVGRASAATQSVETIEFVDGDGDIASL